MSREDKIIEHIEEFDKSIVEVIKFRHSLNDETDRGCALMAAAYLDYELEELLHKYLLDDPKATSNMLKNNGPLSTFSSKIEIAYLLGLIGKNTRKDLNLIRKVRNEFAHKSDPLSFEDDSIKNRCRELHFDPSDETRARQKFTRVVMGVLAQIYTSKTMVNRVEGKSDGMKNSYKELFNKTMKLFEQTLEIQREYGSKNNIDQD